MRNVRKSASANKAKKARKRAASPAISTASPALNLTPKEAAALREAVERIIANSPSKAGSGV